VGSSWKNWNTSPIDLPRHEASREPRSRSTRCPSTVTDPAVGSSIPASRLSRVVLPLPERPTTATNSPPATSRLIPSSAVNGPAWPG
jgi:hypothetical protein